MIGQATTKPVGEFGSGQHAADDVRRNVIGKCRARLIASRVSSASGRLSRAEFVFDFFIGQIFQEFQDGAMAACID